MRLSSIKKIGLFFFSFILGLVPNITTFIVELVAKALYIISFTCLSLKLYPITNRTECGSNNLFWNSRKRSTYGLPRLLSCLVGVG